MAPVWRHYWIALGLLLVLAPLPGRIGRNDPVALRQPLASLSLTLDGWTGRDEPIEERVAAKLGTPDLLLREYENAAGERVWVYVSYFGRQQQGEQSHSPRNCLPGAGWSPVEMRRVPFAFGGRGGGEVNEIVFAKGDRRQVVYYWFRERDRIVASEYLVRWYMVVDAVTRRRTDGALIRISAPVRRSEPETRAVLAEFMRVALPALDRILPE